LRGQGGAKLAEFRPTTKRRNFCGCKNHEPVLNPREWHQVNYTKVRKTVWGSFAHLGRFPREMPKTQRTLVRPRSAAGGKPERRDVERLLHFLYIGRLIHVLNESEFAS
jgi:hypothetical protein